METKRKALSNIALLYWLISMGLFALASVFGDKLSDFAHGFCDGVSVVLMLGSSVFYLWSVIRKK